MGPTDALNVASETSKASGAVTALASSWTDRPPCSSVPRGPFARPSFWPRHDTYGRRLEQRVYRRSGGLRNAGIIAADCELVTRPKRSTAEVRRADEVPMPIRHPDLGVQVGGTVV